MWITGSAFSLSLSMDVDLLLLFEERITKRNHTFPWMTIEWHHYSIFYPNELHKCKNDIIKIVALKAISTNIVQIIPFHVFTSIFSSVIVFVLSSHDWNIETMTHHHLHLLYRHSAVSYTVFHFGIKPKMINIKSINISHLSIGSGAEWVSKNRREEQWWERVIAIF